MKVFPKGIPDLHATMTIPELYDPAMQIEDPEEAQEYLQALTDHYVKRYGMKKTVAAKTAKQWVVYYAAYYGIECAARVKKLFNGAAKRKVSKKRKRKS